MLRLFNIFFFVLATAGLFSCNIGEQGEDKSDCQARYLSLAYLRQSRLTLAHLTDADRQAIQDNVNLLLLAAAACKDPEGDIFTDLFGI